MHTTEAMQHCTKSWSILNIPYLLLTYPDITILHKHHQHIHCGGVLHAILLFQLRKGKEERE